MSLCNLGIFDPWQTNALVYLNFQPLNIYSMGVAKKKRVLWKQTADTLSDVNPGVHVSQIDLTPTDTSTSPRLKLASCSPWFLNDSKIDRHNDAAIQQHTSGHASLHWCNSKEILHSYSQNMYILESSSNSCH
jgi:hypothetical protein